MDVRLDRHRKSMPFQLNAEGAFKGHKTNKLPMHTYLLNVSTCMVVRYHIFSIEFVSFKQEQYSPIASFLNITDSAISAG